MIPSIVRVAAAGMRIAVVSGLLPLVVGAQNTAPARLDDPDLIQLYPIAQKVQVMGERPST